MSGATPAAERDLRARGFRGDITVEAPLAPLTTWRIGGRSIEHVPHDRAADPRQMYPDLVRAAGVDSGFHQAVGLGCGQRAEIGDGRAA